ncbi:hypothetical protein JCM10207_008420 [Rhodosporidiobolus poonsookiae]
MVAIQRRNWFVLSAQTQTNPTLTSPHSGKMERFEAELRRVEDALRNYHTLHTRNHALEAAVHSLVHGVRELGTGRLKHLDRVYFVFHQHQPQVPQPTYFSILLLELHRIALGLGHGIHHESAVDREKDQLVNLINTGAAHHENLQALWAANHFALRSVGKREFIPVARRLA